MRVGRVGKERPLLVFLMESFSFLREVLSWFLGEGQRLVYPSPVGFFLFAAAAAKSSNRVRLCVTP